MAEPYPRRDHQVGAAQAAAPASPASRDLGAELAALDELDLHGLRVRWRKLLRAPAPPHLSPSLLRRILAYRLQANRLGDLDRETIRLLDRVRREMEAGNKVAIPPVPDERSGRIKPGSQLVREHAGTLHRVTVQKSGFDWNGSTDASLSEVARAITGMRWNGPRFFGLRDAKGSAVAGGQA